MPWNDRKPLDRHKADVKMAFRCSALLQNSTQTLYLKPLSGLTPNCLHCRLVMTYSHNVPKQAPRYELLFGKCLWEISVAEVGARAGAQAKGGYTRGFYFEVRPEWEPCVRPGGW